jgi:hypothetical protein
VATAVGPYEVEIITGPSVDLQGVRARFNLFSEQGGEFLGVSTSTDRECRLRGTS